MSTKTEKLGLIKPEQTDFYNIDDFNENSDVLEQAYKEIGDRLTEIENPHHISGANETVLRSGEKLGVALYKIGQVINLFLSHFASSTKHITSEERNNWNAKASTSVATASEKGLMDSTDKVKLDGIATGAQVNTITGIKGNAEGSYRTGNVNITCANIGAAESSHTHSYLSKSGGTMSGGIVFSSELEIGGHALCAIDFNNNDTFYNTGYGPSGPAWNLYGVDGTSNVELLATKAIYLKSYGAATALTVGNNCLRPLDEDGAITLGGSSYRWKQIYATTATISTSDRNLKENIEDISDKYCNLFMGLRPVTYKLKGNHNRLHLGFISQEVEYQMERNEIDPLEFGAFCKDNKVKIEKVTDEDGNVDFVEVPIENEYIYSLRYEEFIALNTKMIQKLYERVGELEKRVEELERKTGE